MKTLYQRAEEVRAKLKLVPGDQVRYVAEEAGLSRRTLTYLRKDYFPNIGVQTVDAIERAMKVIAKKNK